MPDQISLADPSFSKPEKKDMLIGSDTFRNVLREELKKSIVNLWNNTNH